MRIGIYGGTFDPIHYAHLILAEQCRDQCQLDEVWFIPAAQPPHKMTVSISDAKHRCDMVEFAIAGNSAFRLNKIELQRTGPSYTYETLEQLQSEDTSRELFLLIGADSVRDLPQWRRPERILELATIVAVNRGDEPIPDGAALKAIGGELNPPRIRNVRMPGFDLSSTEIRRRIREGKSVRYLVPRAVEAYITENQLYR